jgi:hypothetical protein
MMARMNNLSRSPPPAEPDMALFYLGSLFETLHHAPERDDATLYALAGQIILDERPKTLLGLAIMARAEKWLRQYLWTVDSHRLSPSHQAARAVIDSAMRIECT